MLMTLLKVINNVYTFLKRCMWHSYHVGDLETYFKLRQQIYTVNNKEFKLHNYI